MSLSGESLRFLIGGAINTLASYLLYCLLVAFMHPQLAYALAYLAGIALAYGLNARLVFRVPLRATQAAVYPLLYLAQYAVSALLIQLFIAWGGLGPRLAAALTILLVTPLSFLWNRAFLKHSLRAQSREARD